MFGSPVLWGVIPDSIAVQEIHGRLPARASLFYLRDGRMNDSIPDFLASHGHFGG